ncbi:MAG: ASKHA domain-containing protein [Thermodesulfobacteriota bacterium]|nr:ASKHA domain-containing protein [Thermodesulfobacteriota bacterium]
MSNLTVKFLPHERRVQVPEGESLIKAAMEAGVHINASCGGEGVCGKCRIILEEGEVEGGTSEKLSQEDIDKGVRLACRSRLTGDVTVRVPMESSISDKSALDMQHVPRRKARIMQMDLEQLKEEGLFLPPVEKKYVELPPPDTGENVPDVTRLVNELRLKHDEHKLEFLLPVIRMIPDIIRERDFAITLTLARAIREGGRTRVINVQPGDTTSLNYAIAVDIGTTTVYGEVIDLGTGEILAQNADFNSQVSYGEDIITRIVAAEKPGGLEKLHGLVVSTINGIIKNLLKKSGVDQVNISTITLAGNTTMTQLLLEINPRYIRRSPYVPASTLYPPILAKDIGIELGDHVTALVYPQISSYVGGDIVAGVMGSGLYRREELTLFIDIGTNAEIVIGNKDWMVCAACSAGPAFEGGGITFGMRAAKGAIEDFSIDPVSLEPMILTHGDSKPVGICGSGLIIMVAVLFEMGIIDNRGKLNRDVDKSRIREVDNVYEYVVVWKENTGIDRDIVLTEIDIDNLIRAKGAIYSGCMTLLEEVGLSIDMLDAIVLSGGFGSYVDLEKAITIGLLPEIDAEKVTFIGNGSLMGARMSALTNRIRQDVGEVVQKMTNFELSETKSFMDHYMAALFLPHTEINLFPKLRDRLKAQKN